MTLYERDLVAWVAEQVRLLRAGEFDQLDIQNIVEELEDLEKSERRELASRLVVLLVHLLKWQVQTAFRSRSWENTIREQRRQVSEKLQETPSLRPLLADPAWLAGIWLSVTAEAVRQTGLATFPETCPWPVETILQEGWLPN